MGLSLLTRDRSLRRTVLTSPVHFVAFGFGSGLVAKAPGTAGTLLAVPIYALLAQLPVLAYLAVVVLATAFGVWLCGESAKRLGVHDHGGIVWDEFVGYWITMLFVPLSVVWMVTGFMLFRLFDIWKPWPVSIADKNVGGGLGIMLDDVLAGIYAAVVLHIIIYLQG